MGARRVRDPGRRRDAGPTCRSSSGGPRSRPSTAAPEPRTDGFGGGDGFAVGKDAPPEAVEFLRLHHQRAEPARRGRRTAAFRSTWTASRRRGRSEHAGRARRAQQRRRSSSSSSTSSSRPRSAVRSTTRPHCCSPARPRRRTRRRRSPRSPAAEQRPRVEAVAGSTGHCRRIVTAPIATTPASDGTAERPECPPASVLHQVGQISGPVAMRVRTGCRGRWSSLFLAPGAAPVQRVRALPDRAEHPLQPVRLERARIARPVRRARQLPARVFDDPLFRDACATTRSSSCSRWPCRSRCALGLAVLLNARLQGRALLRTLFFAPYVLSEVVTGVVWRQILRPDGLLDQSSTASAPTGWSTSWLADPNVVLYSLFFVISWKYFGFHMILLLAGSAADPQGARRGGRDRRRLGMADVPPHHVAAARADTAGVDLPLDHRRPAAVRPGLGHDQGRPDRLVLDDGHLSLRSVPQEPVRLRERGLDRDLRVVARSSRCCTSASPCDVTCKGLVSLADASISAAPVTSSRRRRRVKPRTVKQALLYLVALLVLCVVIIPLLFSVLGGFRTQPAARRQAGRASRPVGVAQLHRHPHDRARSGARCGTAR